MFKVFFESLVRSVPPYSNLVTYLELENIPTSHHHNTCRSALVLLPGAVRPVRAPSCLPRRPFDHLGDPKVTFTDLDGGMGIHGPQHDTSGTASPGLPSKRPGVGGFGGRSASMAVPWSVWGIRGQMRSLIDRGRLRCKSPTLPERTLVGHNLGTVLVFAPKHRRRTEVRGPGQTKHDHLG